MNNSSLEDKLAMRQPIHTKTHPFQSPSNFQASFYSVMSSGKVISGSQNKPLDIDARYNCYNSPWIDHYKKLDF